MARYTTANSDAAARGFDPGSVDEDPRNDYVRSPNTLEMVQGADAPPPLPFRTRGTPRPSTFPQSFTVRPWDQDQADRFLGTHGVVSRTPYGPVGEQAAWDQPRAVFRPIPQAWDAGYVRTG